MEQEANIQEEFWLLFFIFCSWYAKVFRIFYEDIEKNSVQCTCNKCVIATLIVCKAVIIKLFVSPFNALIQRIS